MEHSTSTIFAYVSGVDGEVSYVWSPADGLEDPYSWKTVAKPKTTTTYTVTATCGELVASSSLTIKVVEVPKNVKATVDGNDVYIEWDDVEFAESYIVYRDGIPRSTYVPQNSFVDTDLADGTYCYTVKSALDGSETPESKKVCAEINTISVNDIMKNEVSIFPNPTSDVVNVKANRIESFSIYNMMGRELINENIESEEISIDVSDFDSGCYILYVETESEIITRRINVIR